MARGRKTGAPPIAVNGDIIRRTFGRRLAAPLIAATLISAGGAALLRPSAERDIRPRAAPESTIDAPAFVRPPKPSPDVLTAPRVRIG
jgi:hypothetical protein